MKKLLTISIIAAALVLLQASSAAQATYGSTVLLSSSGLTNTTVGATDWTTHVIDCRKATSTDLQITGQASVTEANVVTVSYALSVDGTSYTAAKTFAVTCSAVGGTSMTVCTNIPAFGSGYIKITALSNAASAGGLTNLTIKASNKLLYGK